MRKKSLLIGSVAFGAVASVGSAALMLGAGSSALASNTIPTSQLASTSSFASPRPPHDLRFGGPGRAVYSEDVVPIRSGGYRTIVMVHGPLTAISSTSISVKRPDTGATITASINSSTKFRNTTESTLLADLHANTSVTIRVIETGGKALVVSVPPPPGTRPHPLMRRGINDSVTLPGGTGKTSTSGATA